MKKIFALSLITLIFTINGACATSLSIPELPNLGDLGNTIDNSTDNSIISDAFPNDNINNTNTPIDPLNTSQPEISIPEAATASPLKTPSANNFWIWGGIIVVIAGGLYLYLSRRDQY